MMLERARASRRTMESREATPGTAAVPASLGARLWRLRQDSELSQEALAELAGLSAEAVSGIERGKRGAPRLDSVALLAHASDLGPADRAAFIAASRAT